MGGHGGCLSPFVDSGDGCLLIFMDGGSQHLWMVVSAH